MNIILDTNFLIYAAKYKIDLIAELDRLYGKYDLIVPHMVFLEIEKLRKGKGKGKFVASLALAITKKLIEDKKLKIMGVESRNADEEIIKLLELPELGDEIVATMDSELSRKIKKEVRILKIRQKRYFSE